MIIPPYLNTKWTRKIIGDLFYHYSKLSSTPIFSDLLLERQTEMWDNKLDTHSNDECKNTLLNSSDTIETWHCCPNWHRKLSNKINAKEFAKKCGVKVAKLHWHGSDPQSIPFSKLPSNYVIKTASGWSSKQVLPIIEGINGFTGERITQTEIIHFFSEIRKNPLYKSDLIVEELIQDAHRNILPTDYKVYCFNGKAHYIMAIKQKTVKTCFDSNWKIIMDQINLNCHYSSEVPKPIHFDQIISTAELLSTNYNYPFVRIDLYDALEGVVFGEFTHAPNAGPSRKLYTPFANKTFGKLWTNGTKKQKIYETK